MNIKKGGGCGRCNKLIFAIILRPMRYVFVLRLNSGAGCFAGPNLTKSSSCNIYLVKKRWLHCVSNTWLWICLFFIYLWYTEIRTRVYIIKLAAFVVKFKMISCFCSFLWIWRQLWRFCVPWKYVKLFYISFYPEKWSLENLQHLQRI